MKLPNVYITKRIPVYRVDQRSDISGSK